ncbi:MAG: 26S proteasome regulatory subunit 7, partial [Chaenotheca gracillima]
MTPERAQSASRASTPASVRDESSPVQLTPKSKIRALMASIDDNSSSDSDVERVAQSNNSRSPILEDSAAPHQSSSDTSLQAGIREARKDESQTPKGEKEMSSEEDDEVVARPKGRLAARMQARDTEEQTAPEDREAYKRDKKQLMENSHKNEDSDVIM